MKKLLSLMLIAALSLSLVACTKVDVNIENEAEEEVNAEEENLEHVQVSDVVIKSEDEKTVIISLEGNPTTGYSWYPISYDDQTLNIEKEFVSSNEDPTIAGAGGVFNFKITGLRQGKTLVDFTYMREWEGQGSAIENHPVEVQVSEDLNVTASTNLSR